MADNTIIDITRGLPPYFPRDDESTNYRVLSAVGGAVDSVESDLTDVATAMKPEEATTLSALREQGRLIGVLPRENESIEAYRQRVLISLTQLTSEATINDLIEIISNLLDLAETDITYTETSENGYVIFDVPSTAADGLVISLPSFVELLDDSTAAGFRVGVRTVAGTFTYRSESDYNNTINDSTKGYDDYSTGTVEGGTYSGVLS